MNTLKFCGIGFAIVVASVPVKAAQVFVTDLVVQGSTCVGLDCVNGESFGFDTLRLKENNLRIHFQDTSVSASFPTNDWRITANDTTNGGVNKFSIDDADSGRTPFTIEASAPSHSLYVDDGGRIGLGTSTPVVEMHVVNGDSPTLRLEQDGSSGFTAQTWDVAGNETNFFVRDATNGSKIPFKIRPGAPDNSIYIDTDGDIGLGDATPDAALDIESGNLLVTQGDLLVNNQITSGSDQVLTVNASNNTVAFARLIELNNPGGTPYVRFNMSNTSNANDHWNFQARHTDSSFRIVNGTNSGEELILSPEGNLTINGNLEANGTLYSSSLESKENFSPLDKKTILSKLAELNIREWNYIKDADDIKHIGPTSEEFHSAFGLNGDNNKAISISDIAGITLAAIQQLKTELDEKSKEIALLRKRLQEK